MFNFHDIALILVVFQALLLGTLLLSIMEGKILCNRLLALFITAVGLEALETLVYWCVPLKELYFQDLPVVFFALKTALLLQGPLLFFYVKSLIYTDFAFRKRDLLHLLPALIYPAYLALMLMTMGETNLQEGMTTYGVYWDNYYYRALVLAQSGSVFLYALASLNLMTGYTERLKQNYSNLNQIERTWLKILILGFSFLCCWNLSAHLLGMIYSTAVSSAVGLGGNYLDLLFINLLVFYNLLHSHVVQGIRDPARQPAERDQAETEDAPHAQPAGKKEFSKSSLLAVERAMLERKAYLQHDLTLVQLASLAGLPPRTTSHIINRHFGMSFFDFVNSYRVATAKDLLVSAPEQSVLEISERAGFNSKSAFNRFFKKFAGTTPTEYRRQATETDNSPVGAPLAGARLNGGVLSN